METRPIIPGPPAFTSALTKRETILVLAYLPVHLVVLQFAFGALITNGALTQAYANFLYYAVGALYMLAAGFAFLRRDFDPLADRPFLCLREILRSLLALYCCNILLAFLFEALPIGAESPNDESIIAVASQDARLMKAELIYLTPIVEEMLFRAGIFGVLRRKSRLAAYAVSAVCFSLCHVAAYAVYEPLYWLFLLQYLPVSLLLARLYERCNTIWAPILYHMAVNALTAGVLLA